MYSFPHPAACPRPAPGVCPDCHGTFLEKRKDGWYCPQCLTKAELSMVDGELRVEFTPEARSLNRWGECGQKKHIDGISRGHGRAEKGKEIIKEGYACYGEDEFVVQLPEVLIYPYLNQY